VTNLPHIKDFASRENITDLGNLVVNMMNEGKAVAKAQDIELYEDPWEMNVNAVNRGKTGEADYAHVPSMLDDVRAKRLTEVDWLTGAIVREGRKLGIATPIHEVMYGLVKGIEHAWARDGEGS
jgi:2-dehydropantoate 2-reductase